MAGYRPLQERLLKVESDSSNDSTDGFDHAQPVKRRWFRKERSITTTTICAVVLAFTISLMINTVMLIKASELDKDAICVAYTSQSRPSILDDTTISYSTIEFNGSFARESIYRQQASPEVDAAWAALGTVYRPLIIQEANKATRAGLDPGLAKRSPELGGGFPVNVEALHHLHCLNLLRQTLHWNYDYYAKQGAGAFVNDEDALYSHTGHCLDIIRQQLMCTADFNVFGHVWVDPIDSPFPDFMTKHKCKNFDAIRQWAHDRQIPEDQVDNERFMWRRPGDVLLPTIP